MSDPNHLRVVDGQEEARAPSEPPPDPLIGRTIDGRYHVEAGLGEGGMGIVYKARHTVLGKPLAIKVLRPEVSNDEEILTRFRQEAQSASGIGNQHIIDISDFGTLPDSSTYFVMEYLEGVDLTGAIEAATSMTPERAVGIAKQLCRALGAAHEAGIVHRDLKPDNIYLIERGGQKDFVKVLDFGIAKVGSGTKRLTKAGQVFGTPHYMSPEQCSGSGTDHRTDIYALGVILYEMCCGRVPFDADNLMGVLTKHMYEQPIPPHELPPPVKVPAALEAVMLKALSKSADGRYQTMQEMSADLEKCEIGHTPDAVLEAVDRRSATGIAARSAIENGGYSATVGAPSVAPKSKGVIVTLGVLGIGALGAVGAFAAGLFDASPQPVRQEPAAVVAVPQEVPTPASDPDPEIAAAPAEEEDPVDTEPEEVGSIALNSEPSGVEVWRDGELLGNTPVDIPRPTGEERLELTLRKARFEEKAVRISSFTADSVTITMDRLRRTGRATAMRTQMGESAADPAMAPAMAPATPMRSGPQSEVLDPWQ